MDLCVFLLYHMRSNEEGSWIGRKSQERLPQEEKCRDDCHKMADKKRMTEIDKSDIMDKNKKSLDCSRDLQAADGNRTRDLRTTNATLYRLSHSSISMLQK